MFRFDESGVKGAFRVTATAFLDGLLLITTQDVSELTKTQTRLRAVIDSLLDPHVQLEPVRDSAGTNCDGPGARIDFQIVDAALPVSTSGIPTKNCRNELLTFVPGISKELLGKYVNVVENGELLIRDDYVYVYEQEIISGELRHHDIRVAKMNGGLTYTWHDVTDRHQQQAKEQERVAELERSSESPSEVSSR